MIRNRSDLLKAMREDLDKRIAEGRPGDSFVESYPIKQADAFARELAKQQDVLKSYFSAGEYGAAVSGRKKDRYTVLKALEYSYDKGMIDAKEFVNDLAILVRDDSKCGVNVKKQTADIVKGKNKTQTAAVLSRDIVPVLLQIYLKEKKDDFRRNTGFHVTDRSDSKEDGKKKIYGDDISMLRDFEEYRQALLGKALKKEQSAGTSVKKTASDEEYLPLWKKMYELLRKRPDAGGIAIPLITDEYCGTGIYILGRDYLLCSKTEEYKKKYPEWYRNNKWFITSSDRCFISVLRLESLTIPQGTDVDIFSLDADGECIFTGMRYGVDVCADLNEAFELYEKFRTENNYHRNVSLCGWPECDDEELKEHFMRYFEYDMTLTDEEKAAIKDYKEKEQKEKEALEKRQRKI